jgi:hypothetical protein
MLGLGGQEILILAILGIPLVIAPVAVLVFVLSRRSKAKKSDPDE